MATPVLDIGDAEGAIRGEVEPPAVQVGVGVARHAGLIADQVDLLVARTEQASIVQSFEFECESFAGAVRAAVASVSCREKRDIMVRISESNPVCETSHRPARRPAPGDARPVRGLFGGKPHRPLSVRGQLGCTSSRCSNQQHTAERCSPRRFRGCSAT